MSLVEAEDLAEELRLWRVDCWKEWQQPFSFSDLAKDPSAHLPLCTGSLEWPWWVVWQPSANGGTSEIILKSFRRSYLAILKQLFLMEYILFSDIHKSRKPQERSTLLKKGFAYTGRLGLENVNKPWHTFISTVFVYSLAKTRHSWGKSMCKGLLAVRVRPPCYGADTSAIGIWPVDHRTKEEALACFIC